MSTHTEERNPYVGPRPFERQHALQFYGREREVRDLLSLVTANRFVLLYAASGAGKTSLLNAGLVPALEEDAFEILPPARVRGAVTGDITTEAIPNVYVFNAIMSWATEDIDPRALVNLSLSDLFRVQVTQGQNGQQDEEPEPLPRVVIFDQFEELFTTYAERWEDREGFFQQLADALVVDPYLRVVVAIREDFVAQLDSYAHLLPGTLQTRYHIEQLDAQKALSAIKDPLAGTPYRYEEGLAERLVEELRKSVVKAESGETVVVVGQYVEPVQLQVVCRSLLDRVMRSGDDVIEEEDVQALGGVTQPLSDFYEMAVLRATNETDIPEVGLRAWFGEHLITPAGTRGIVYRGSQTTAGISNVAIDILEDAHLIRGQWRAGARWYELTHDRLIGPIQQSNQRWREELQARRLRRITSLTLAGLGVLVVAVLVLAARNATISSTGSAANASATMTLAAAEIVADEALQGQLVALFESAQAYQEAGNHDLALEKFGEVLAQLKGNREQDRALEAQALLGQGVSLIRLGQSEAALAPLESALALQRELGDTAGAASTLFYIGVAQRNIFPEMEAPEQVAFLAELIDTSPGDPLDDLDVLARAMYFGLDTNKQVAVFGYRPVDDQGQDRLATVAGGLYVSLDVNAPGSRNVLSAMLDALGEGQLGDHPTLVEELTLLQAAWDAQTDGAVEEAIDRFNALLALNPRVFSVYADRAAAYAQLGEFASALADLEQLWSLSNHVAPAPGEFPVTGQRFTDGNSMRLAACTTLNDFPELGRLLVATPEAYPALNSPDLYGEFAFETWPTDFPAITQSFGANPESYTRFGLPGHEGVDFGPPAGSNVYAVADGTVIRAETDPSPGAYGIHIRIRHIRISPDGACTIFTSIYAHLNEALVSNGQSIHAGDVIGLSGCTGDCFGDTLHLGLQKVGATAGGETTYPSDIINPEPFLAELAQQGGPTQTERPTPTPLPTVTAGAVGFDSPVGTEAERLEDKMWPGSWFDATGYATFIALGAGSSYHTGADLNLNVPTWDADRGQPVYAAGSGQVTFSDRLQGFGWVVVIRHDPLPDGTVVWTRYAGVDNPLVEEDQTVARGEQIANIGNADGTQPYNLHFDVATTDVLETNPGHYPGANQAEVLENYADPQTFIEEHRPR